MSTPKTKGTVTTMAEKPNTPNVATNAALSHTYLPVDITKCHVDYDWNSRSRRNVEDMADTESGGYEGFKGNIRTAGQITAIILRNTGGKTLAGGKTDKQFEVVCGFRRFKAISDIYAGKETVPNLPPGTILAEVRDVKTVTEARILNGLENTGRRNLKASDMVFLANELEKDGLNQTAIADSLNITQGWVSKLLKIGKLPTAILDHWRDDKPIAAVQTKDGVFELKGDPKTGKAVVSTQLTEPEMRALAELKGNTPEELIARYIRTVKPAPSQGEGPGAPEEDKVLKNVVETAALMGSMVRAGILYTSNDSLECDWNRVIGPKKDGYPIDCGKDRSQDRLIELGDAAQRAFEHEASKKKNENPKTTNATPSAN